MNVVIMWEFECFCLVSSAEDVKHEKIWMLAAQQVWLLSSRLGAPCIRRHWLLQRWDSEANHPWITSFGSSHGGFTAHTGTWNLHLFYADSWQNKAIKLQDLIQKWHSESSFRITRAQNEWERWKQRKEFYQFYHDNFCTFSNPKINFFVLFSGSPKELKNQAGVTRV